MIIKEEDFRTLPFRGKIVSILEQLDRLEAGKDPTPLFRDLMSYVQDSNSTQAIPLIFPYIAKMTMNRKEFSYVHLLASLKLSFYHRRDLSKLSHLELRQYWGIMHAIRESLPAKTAGEHKTWNQGFRSSYIWNLLMIHSDSQDAFVLSRFGRMEDEFGVLCPCCHKGENVTLQEETKQKITPSSYRPQGTPSTDEVYAFALHLSTLFEEEYFGELLPYVYGEYPCSHCQKRYVLMDGMRGFVQSHEPEFLPTTAYLNRLESMLQQPESSTERWVIATQLASAHRNLEGNNSLHAMEVLLKYSRQLHRQLPAGTFGDILAKTEEILENDPQITPKYGEMTAWMGHYYSMMQDDQGNLLYPEKAEAYFQKAYPILLKTLGKSHLILRTAQVNYVLFRYDYASEGKVEILLDFYQGLQGKKDLFSLIQMERALSAHYCRLGEYQEALVYHRALLEHIPEEYGNSSVNMARALYQAGEIYLGLEEYFNGNASCQQALDLHLGVIGQDYLLPSAFRGCHKGNKTLSKAGKLKFLSQGREASLCVARQGDILQKEGLWEEAIEKFQNSLDLWAWFSDVPFIYGGEQYLSMAECHQELGNKEKAKDAASRSLSLLKIRLQQHSQRKEQVVLKENIQKAEAILANTEK